MPGEGAPPLFRPPRDVEVIVRGVMFHGEHVLWCRSRERGHCYLPGGHVEPGESVAEALRREMLEEAGLTVEVGAVRMVAEHRYERGGAWHHEWIVHVAMSAGGVLKDGRTPPPPVESREAGLEFVWARPGAVVDVRPAWVVGWLAGALAGEGGRGGGGDVCWRSEGWGASGSA